MRFNVTFEEAYRKQTSWVVQDGKLRDQLKVSIAKKLVPEYREFYDMYLAMLTGEKNLELLVRFSPDDLGNYLSDLFHGTSTSGSFTSSSSLFQSQGCIPRWNNNVCPLPCKLSLIFISSTCNSVMISTGHCEMVLSDFPIRSFIVSHVWMITL